MNFIVIYAIATIISLSSYLFMTNYLTLNDFRESFKFITRGILKEFNLSRHKTIEITDFDIVVSKTGETLNKSLKHLEFIGELEYYMENNNECALSTDCLHELEHSKYKAQVSVLKSTSLLQSIYIEKAA